MGSHFCPSSPCPMCAPRNPCVCGNPKCPTVDEEVGTCHSCRIGKVVANGNGTFRCLACKLDIHGPWWPS